MPGRIRLIRRRGGGKCSGSLRGLKAKFKLGRTINREFYSLKFPSCVQKDLKALKTPLISY